MIFSHLELSNFLSYGNTITKVNLKSNTPTLILGKNYSASSDGADSNGSGKSSILNAICFALYDEILAKTSKDRLINNINKKDLLVNLYFSIDDVKYKISRYRKNKKLGGDGVKLFFHSRDEWEFNDEDDHTPDSISNTNKLIEKIVRKPFDVFSRIVVFSATHKPFLALPTSSASEASQIAILEELFGYTEVTEKAEKLKEKLKDYKSTFQTTKAINDALVLEHARHKESIERVKTRINEWDEKQEQKIFAIRNEIDTLQKIDFSNQKSLLLELTNIKESLLKLSTEEVELSNKIKNYNDTKKKISDWTEQKQNKTKLASDILEQFNINFEEEFEKIKKISNLEIEIKSTKNSITTILNDIINLDKVITQKQNELTHLQDNTCPFCKQTFAESKSKIIEIETQLQNLTAQINDLVEKKEIENEKLKITCDNLETIKSSILMDERSLNIAQEKYKNAKSQLEILNNSECPFVLESLFLEEDALVQNKEMREELQAKTDIIKRKLLYASEVQLALEEAKLSNLVEKITNERNAINPFVSELESLNNEKLPNLKNDEIDELSNLIEHTDFLIKLLTKKDSFVRKNLLNANLPLLNSRLKIYLEKLGLPHKVIFTENMSAEIKMFDAELEYNQLSSGQKARINLALFFAFRDVLQYRHGDINFCMLDECLDVGLGIHGVQSAIKMIKEIAKEQKLSLFVISHRDEANSMFDKKLLIEYRDGFSNIVEQ